MTKMTAEKTDLQKLENLLNSATNERQRKMYLKLLNKARAELAPDSSAPKQQKTTESSTKKTQTTASTKKKARGKSSLDKAPSASKKTSSIVNATSEKDKASSIDDSIVVTEEISTSNNSTSVAKTNQIKQDKKLASTKTKAQKQSKKTNSSDKTTSSPTSDSTKKAYFSGVGIIKCTPYLEDEKLFVTIDEQQYELQKVVGVRRKQIDLLKSSLEQNGSREMLLRVYPNIIHHSDGSPPYHLFRLVQFYLNEEQYSDFPEEFIFRGIWRVISYCSSPVITINRNINRLGVYKNLSSVAQKYFAKSQDFPVVWDAPVEPFKYDSQRRKSEQMPCYFVQVKATFKNGQYIVTEMLSEPTLEIPRFIQPPKKNRNSQNKSQPTNQSNQTNQLDQESDSATEAI